MNSGMAKSSTSIDLAERGDLVDGVVGEEELDADRRGTAPRARATGDAEQQRQDDPRRGRGPCGHRCR